MVMPSTPVILVGIAVFAILVALDWFVAGMAYSRKPLRRAARGSPRIDDARWIKKRLKRAA